VTSSRKTPWITALAVVLTLVAFAMPHAETIREKPLDVPYVPTPEIVVAKMLELVKPTKDDVLYDLGSGDGRIVIEAARRFGTRGVGIDLNPERIKEANENAEQANVADRVRFVLGDIFEANISEATIVTMYLLPDVNLRLRPKLLAQLGPGSRIVSHDYDLGDWTPQTTVTVKNPGGREHTVHFWVVPRHAAGRQ
jgi:SAM-dependent methyltransferase